MSHDPNRPDSKTDEATTNNHAQQAAGQDGLPHDGPVSGDPRDAAARQLGFRSYAWLVKSSTPIASRDGCIHMIVENHDGRWMVWREETWPEYRTFDSIHHAGRAADEGTN